MNFSTFEKVSSGNLIYFKNAVPIENAGSLKFYKDNASGSFLKKEMRWSFDREHWANWEDLNVGSIAKISTGDNRYLFFEIKYTQSNTQSKVSTFSIEYLPATGKTYVPTDNIHPDNNHTLPAGCNDIGGTTKTYETIKITDAETLCGKSCDYYLWRPNHKGQQPISSITDLQNILNQLIASAGVTQIYVDGSLAARDASISWLMNQNYLKESSIGTGFTWNAGKLDVSVSGDVTKIYIDGSLATRDSSIIYLFNYINDLSTFIHTADASNIKGAKNIGGGPGEIFKQIASNTIELRTITSGSAALDISTLGDQVIITFDASVSGETVWKDSTPVSADVGGISGGYVVPLNSNSIEILDKILYEYFPPNINLYLNPSAGYYQKWVDAPEVSIYGNFNNDDFVKAKIYDASLLIDNLPDPDPAFAHIPYADVSSGNFLWNDTAPPYGVSWDDVTYTIKLYHKVNSINMPPAEASAAIKFVNPYIFGIINTPGSIDSSTLEYFHSIGQKKVVPKQSNEIEFIRPTGIIKARFIYAYDASYEDLKNIFDIRNDFNVTSSFNAPIIINIDLGVQTNIPYKVYVKSHWIDVSSFKLIFNI